MSGSTHTHISPMGSTRTQRCIDKSRRISEMTTSLWGVGVAVVLVIVSVVIGWWRRKRLIPEDIKRFEEVVGISGGSNSETIDQEQMSKYMIDFEKHRRIYEAVRDSNQSDLIAKRSALTRRAMFAIENHDLLVRFVDILELLNL